jgi:hypothetical protein
LLDVAGIATIAALRDAVTDCVATWNDRGVIITEKLTGG